MPDKIEDVQMSHDAYHGSGIIFDSVTYSEWRKAIEEQIGVLTEEIERYQSVIEKKNSELKGDKSEPIERCLRSYKEMVDNMIQTVCAYELAIEAGEGTEYKSIFYISKNSPKLVFLRLPSTEKTANDEQRRIKDAGIPYGWH